MARDIEFFRQEYEKQKKLEVIVNSRVLNRPRIKKWQVMASFVILPFLLFFSTLFCMLLKISLPLKLSISVLLDLIILELHLRFCFILVVKCYQRYAKEETRRRCKCIPSCSEYAIISLKTIYPLPRAIKKIRKRLYVTCDGEDYIIDFPIKKMGEKFESKIQ